MLWGNDVFTNHLRQLNWLGEEVQNWLDRYEPHQRPEYPVTNIWSSESEVLVTAEVPGLKAEDLDINLKDQLLTIKGKRTLQKLSEGERLLKQERTRGAFSRTLHLPFTVELNQVEAALKNGVLQIRLPRAEADKPRKIKVVTS
jgi:HSP20 family protein